jgi:LuxR family maltose regulon positive regulatory protein
VAASVAAGLGAGQLASLSRYALAEALQGRLHHARELVAAAEKLAEEQSGGNEAAVPAALAMAAAWGIMEAGAPAMAQSALTGPRMAPEPLERGLLEALEEVLWSRTERVLRREVPPPERNGRVGAVPDWLQELLAQERVALHLAAGHAAEARTAAADVPAPGGARARVLTARADLALGDRRTAARLDPAALERMGGVPVDVQVDAWLVEAQARLAAGSREQAVTAVRRGVRLARPEALRRPFHEASQEVRRVWGTDPALSEAARWLSATTVPPALARVSPAKRPRNGRDEAIIVDALSARETEVLRHLADLLTTEEVAEAMFVSVNTVKSHIRSILRKLSVSRRNEAIRRARELDVI